MSTGTGETFDSPWVRAGRPFLQPFLSEGELRLYKAGAVIYSQGEYSPGVFYIHRGRFKTTIYYEDGREKVLAVQEAPTTFGETAAFDGEPHFCTAVALTDCQIYLFRKNVIRRLLHTNPELSLSLLEAIGRKLRLLALQVEDLTFLGAPPRIAHLLTKLLVDYGIITESGERLSIPITHQELADVAGTSRITVTTVLNQLEKEGIIRKKRRTIYVSDKAKLIDFTQQSMRRGRPERPPRNEMREQSQSR